MLKPASYKPLVALTAGLIWPLAFAPWNLWPLLLLSIALAWWSQRHCTAKQAAWHGFLFGFGLFGFGVNWLHVSIHTYGFTPLWLAIPMTALFAAGMSLYPALHFYLSHRLGNHFLIFIGLWVIIDWIRGWFLTGFPWLYAGYALIDTPLANLASIGGIWLVSLMAVISGVTLARIFIKQSWKENKLINIGLLVFCCLSWGSSALLSSENFTEAKSAPINVALVQGNIPQDLKWLTTQQSATRQIYHELTTTTADNSLVIWPESAITEFYQDALDFMSDESTRLAARNSSLISGTPWRIRGQNSNQYFNSIVVAGSTNVYHKQKLVPFGEYVPLQDFLRGIIPFFDLPMSSFTPGSEYQPNLSAQGIIIAPFICYEILYPELVAQRSQDSDVLLTISNDAWFGTSAGPHQHFEMTRLRAIETGRWLVRGTNNGITAIIDPKGNVVHQLPQFERSVLEGTVQARTGLTPFQRTGELPWLILSLILVVAGRWIAKQTASEKE